jgi:hypothetical protein
MEVGIGLWVLLAVAVGILASRGFSRSGIGWFVLALIFSPLAGVLLFILPARRRPCPFCAEPIQPSAVVCRFCGRDVGAVTDHPGLPKRTRILLLILIVAVLVIALSQCDYRYFGWRGDAPIQVKRSSERKNVIRYPSFVTRDGQRTKDRVFLRMTSDESRITGAKNKSLLEAKELSAHRKGEVISPQFSVLSCMTED